MTYDSERCNYLFNQERSKEVVNELVELNTGLVFDQLKSFNLYNDEDAISYAFEGLYKAVVTFNVDSGNKFSTYAVVCIRNSIQQLIRKRNSEAKVVLLSLDSFVIDTITLGDTIEDPRSREDNSKTIISAVYDIIDNHKNDKTKCILYEWVKSDFTATNREIAMRLGVSQPYVSNVINEFRARLRKKLRG